MIVFKSSNIEVEFDGVLDDFITKTSRVVTEATDGSRDESYTRAMQEYDVMVNECNQANYKKLKQIFMFENYFDITDTKKNIKDGTFFINSDTLKLTPNEDKENVEYIYTGTIPISKV